MYRDKKIIAIIPARSGSKGVKDKNIKELCGKPLIAYTIEAAQRSNVFDCIISIGFIYFFVPILGFSGYIISIFISEVIDFTLSRGKIIKTFKKTYLDSTGKF